MKVIFILFRLNKNKIEREDNNKESKEKKNKKLIHSLLEGAIFQPEDQVLLQLLVQQPLQQIKELGDGETQHKLNLHQPHQIQQIQEIQVGEKLKTLLLFLQLQQILNQLILV